ncbi:polysaccharide biosynthesis/export family protein [Methylobacterium sp. E-005]|uniref:polysaccharide biosynthesis/export family protein n=1 Tax=Methylobacterium sp. E-005 TaxID=2836549 RepID=UPI001FBBE053|nr:polysaccharide biosynthesis/export family protein [Methylobacterium sp. E-005]MCJ2089600.1 polysaccharide biosynthesis/export family protein [Methylobacterium sp. E-005]
MASSLPEHGKYTLKYHAVKLFFFQMIVMGVLSTNAYSQARYTVGPEDRIALKVWDVRNGDPYQWVALTGEFIVGADGRLSLPLIGEVPVAGLTTGELATAVGTQLKNKVGLSTTPTASVQIIKYRPFYVTGAVQHPGKYEYVPSLTVMQAISIAEGMRRARDNSRVERDVISGSGDARVLKAERIALLVRQARLNAEISGQNSITYPQEITQQATSPAVKLAMQQETSLFVGRREALDAQLATINQAKKVLQSQLTSLESKDNNIMRQLSLTRKDLANVNELASKGMVIAQRQISAEQSVATLEGGRLDIQLATLKAQQDLSQADRDIVSLTTKFKTDALSEISTVRSRLDENQQKLATATSLTDEAKSFSEADLTSDDEGAVEYIVVRAHSGERVNANLMTRLDPGDVLQVVVRKNTTPPASSRASTADQ